MDDDTLAPMADALSATLAVIVLLICFFILAQVVAVDKQIKIKKIGEETYMKQDIELDFKDVTIVNGSLRFFKSFDVEDNKEVIDDYLRMVQANCMDCDQFNIISNYPLASISSQRSKRGALTNAIKILPFLVKRGMEYEIELSNSANYHYLTVEAVSTANVERNK